jgi:O-antigen ligase
MATIALPTTRASNAGAGWGARCAAAAIVVASFWLVGHSLEESQVIAEETALGPDRAENRVAVQQAETTTSSAVGFFLLGGAGGLLLLSAPMRRLKWNYGLILLSAIFVVWCSLTMLWSIDQMQSLRKLVIFGLMLAAAFGAATRFELEDLAWVLVLALTAIVGVGVLAEAANGTLRPWRSDYRFCGTVHPNDQGVQCALLALAAAFAERRGTKRRWWLRTLMILAMAGLWFTKSRTTLAAFVMASAVGLIMRSRGMQRWLVLSSCLTVACLGGIAYSFASVSILDQTADVAAMGRRKDINSLTGRLPLWEELLKAAHRRPWLGYGYGGFWNSENTFTYSEIFAWHIPHGHNSYLDLVLNIGIVGLGLYVVWYAATVGTAAARYERTGRSGILFGLCLCAFAVVHGITESKFPGTGIGGLALWIVMAMTAIERRETAPVRTLARSSDGPRWRPTPASLRGAHSRLAPAPCSVR